MIFCSLSNLAKEFLFKKQMLWRVHESAGSLLFFDG